MAELEINYGKLKGSERDGIYAFKGIPYALPPVGEWRWQPPQDPWPWVGVLDATDYGKWAPQNKSFRPVFQSRSGHAKRAFCAKVFAR